MNELCEWTDKDEMFGIENQCAIDVAIRNKFEKGFLMPQLSLFAAIFNAVRLELLLVMIDTLLPNSNKNVQQFPLMTQDKLQRVIEKNYWG